MTEAQAKEVLLAYRPWTNDAQDPEVAEALTLARTQPELQRWLEAHCARQEALRAKFQEIRAPEGLMQQILSEQCVTLPTPPAQSRRRAMVGALAGLVIVLAVGSMVQSFWPKSSTEDLSFNGYRQRMIKTALRAYGMDLETNDLAQVRTFLAARQGVADFELPPKLAATETVGCGLLHWQGKPVSMVCFRTGKPLEPGSKSDLLLFVIAEKDLQGGGSPEARTFAKVSELLTASWRAGDKVYVLAGFADEEVRQRL